MRQSFKVSFYLRSNYENKEGKSPVMLRIFLGGAMSNLGSTKIFVDKSQWNNKTSRQKGRSSEALAVNASLDAISTNLHNIYRKYEDDLKPNWGSCRLCQGICRNEGVSAHSYHRGVHKRRWLRQSQRDYRSQL